MNMEAINGYEDYDYGNRGPLSSLDGDQGCQVTIEMIGGKYGYV
jgi:hypothetical protein